MPILVQDEYKNESGTTYDTLEEFTDFFNVKRDSFFTIANSLNIEGWDGETYSASVANITTESFNDEEQVYTRVTEWPDLDTYNTYRDAVTAMDFDTGDLASLKNGTLGLGKVTTILD